MTMRVIIYLGHFKTGSSSLQRFLASNWRALLYQGILYPSTEAQGAARNLRLLRNGADEPETDTALNILEPHNALALRMKHEEDNHIIPAYYPDLPPAKFMLDNMMRQVTALEPRVVVIAAEVFSVLAETETLDSIRRLAWRLEKFDVTFVCNLRRPDLHIASWDLQRLRFGLPVPPLREHGFSSYINSVHLDYIRLLTAWQTHFPNATFVVRNINDVRRTGGTVKQMLRLLDVPNPAILTDIPDQNPSIPRAFSMAARNVLDVLPAESARPLIRAIGDAGPEVPHIDDGKIELFGRPNRVMMSERFGPIHEKLNAMTGAAPFFPDVAEMLNVNPISDVQAGRESWSALREWLLQSPLEDQAREWVVHYRPSASGTSVQTEASQ
jgi:hypothetical protein